MTARVDQLAARFAAVNDAVIALVAGCTDEQWRRPCAGEVWPIGVVAHHVGVVNRDFLRIVEALASGRMVSPGSSVEAGDRSNARHARDHAAVGKRETLEALRTNGAALAHSLRRPGDEQLARAAGVFGGKELSVAQVVERVVIGHARRMSRTRRHAHPGACRTTPRVVGRSARSERRDRGRTPPGTPNPHQIGGIER